MTRIYDYADDVFVYIISLCKLGKILWIIVKLLSRIHCVNLA